MVTQTKITLDEVVAQMGKNPLPDGYLSVSLGPNRAMRRTAAQRTARTRRHIETWARGLLAAGINPEDVLVARRERRKQPRVERPRVTGLSRGQRKERARVARS